MLIIAMAQDSDQSLDQANLPGPSGWFTFLYYFSTTILVVTVIGSRGLHLPWAAAQLYQYGLLLGTVAGLLGVIFNRTTQCQLSFRKKATYQRQVDQLLTTLGYEQDTAAMERQPDDGPGFVIYHKTGLAGLFAGRVFLLWQQKSVQIISRAANIRQLRRQLEA